MNKRIKELAEQCGFRNNPDIYDRNQSFDIGKFAELIVGECIRLCDQVDIVGADECIDNIKQHFGVEQ